MTKKYDWIKIKQAELQKIETITTIPYEELKELYIESAKYLGPGFDCMVMPLVREIVETSIVHNVKLYVTFKLKTRKMLPSDPNWVSEVYEFKIEP